MTSWSIVYGVGDVLQVRQSGPYACVEDEFQGKPARVRRIQDICFSLNTTFRSARTKMCVFTFN